MMLRNVVVMQCRREERLVPVPHGVRDGVETCKGDEEAECDDAGSLPRGQRFDRDDTRHVLLTAGLRQAAPFSQNSRASCRERVSLADGTSTFTASGATAAKNPASPIAARPVLRSMPRRPSHA